MKNTGRLSLAVCLLAVALLLGFTMPSTSASPAQAAPAAAGGTGYYAASPFEFTPAYGSPMPAYDVQMITNPGAGEGKYFAPVDLPNGVTVTRLVFYYLDNDPQQNITGKLWLSPYINRSQNLLVSFSSGGENPVVRFNEYTGISNAVIDLGLNTYYLEINLPPGGLTGVTGIRIEYSYPTYVPLVQR